MGRCSICLIRVLLFLAAMAITAMAELVNKSGSSYVPGLYWSTAKENDDLILLADSQYDFKFNGGFSSLDEMLQLAIGGSDPAKSKEKVEDVKPFSLEELEEIKKLKKRQTEIMEQMEKLVVQFDAQLMQIAIDDLQDSSLSLEDRHRVLQELLVLVERIHNANDLSKFGGLLVIIQELNHSDSDVRRLAAWMIGKASQYSSLVQRQVLELGALPRLMKMVKSDVVEEAVKGLYAVSALIQNNFTSQEIFYAENGDLLLQAIMCNSTIDTRLQKKALFLVGNLAECQQENPDKNELPFFSNHTFLKSIVDLTNSHDLDLLKKALMAIKSLMCLRTTEALVLKNFCCLDGALENIKQRLQDLMLEQPNKDYIVDLEVLRCEVELIFYTKLREVVSMT